MLAAGLTLAACGAGASSHVVGSVPAQGGESSGSRSPSGSVATGGSAGGGIDSVLSPEAVAQITSELGALDNALSQADSDLANPQSDQ